MIKYTFIVCYYNGQREQVTVSAKSAYYAFQEVLKLVKHEPKYIMLMPEGVQK